MTKAPVEDPGILLTDLNVILRGCGVRRPAEVLATLIGIIGLRVLVLEATRP